MKTDITGLVALVTGANRGLGAEFVRQLLDRGVAKVYAAVRRPDSLHSDDGRIVPLELDVTDEDSIRRAAAVAGDVTLLVNNAGIDRNQSLVTGDLALARAELDTNFWGPVLMTRAFAPIIEHNGGGGVISMHSALSWYAVGSYSVSKAALWSATNSTRVELALRGIHVVGVHVGWVDTDMASEATSPKETAGDVVAQALDAIEARQGEVVVGDVAQRVKSALTAPVEALYPQLRA